MNQYLVQRHVPFASARDGKLNALIKNALVYAGQG